MIKFIKKTLKKIKWGYRADQKSYVDYLKKIGVRVGDNIEIFSPQNTYFDVVNPHLLEIGSSVSMTGPATILTHDYGVCVTKVYSGGEVLGKQKKTTIGNNVFIGWGACILPGTFIGDNTIIGAYAVVSGKLQPNSVYAGNPARLVCSIDEYYLKRKNAQLNEAVEVFREYETTYEKEPPEELFHEYFLLFRGGRSADPDLPAFFEKKFYDHGNYTEAKIFYDNHKPMFDGYEQFRIYAASKIQPNAD